MSNVIHRCQHDGCVYEATYQVRMGTAREWLYVCPTHRIQFHTLEYCELVAVYERAQPRRSRLVGNS